MQKKTYFYLIIANILGVICPLFHISFIHNTAETISTVFLNILQLISVPIVFLSITSTISGMKDITQVKHIALKLLKYTLLTTIIAATIALILFLIIDPANTLDQTSTHLDRSSFSGYLQAISKIVPSNLIEAFRENNVIGIAFIAVLFSISILFLPQENKKTLNQVFSSLFAALLKMTSIILKVLPIGIFAFVYLFVEELQENFAKMTPLLLYGICIVLANLIHACIVLPILLKMKGISPLKTFKGMSSALLLGFFSKSSNAALPVTMKCAEENLNVDRKLSSFSFPLCSVINMNACAGFILITVLFVSSSNGMVFSPLELIGWIFVATIAAIGNAGVPMGCYFLTGAFLVGMNVPLTLLGMILPLYAVLDMLETAINIWSDSCITAIADKELKQAAIEEGSLSVS